jgi:hypothetical protein
MVGDASILAYFLRCSPCYGISRTKRDSGAAEMAHCQWAMKVSEIPRRNQWERTIAQSARYRAQSARRTVRLCRLRTDAERAHQRVHQR